MLSSEQFDLKQSAVKEPKFMYGMLKLDRKNICKYENVAKGRALFYPAENFIGSDAAATRLSR